MAAENRELRGFAYDGTPVFAPTRKELARKQPLTEEFDCVQQLSDGRLVTETGWNPERNTYQFHEVDQRGNVLWDKPIDQATVEREFPKEGL